MSHQPTGQRDRHVAVTDRDKTTPIVATVLGVLAALFLAWLFLFSGILSDSDVEGDRTQNIDVDVERDDQGDGTNMDADTDADTDMDEDTDTDS